MSLWAREHGENFEVPAEVFGIEGIRDISWANDTCPRFAVTEDGQGPNLWVDHPEADEREMLGARFLVQLQAGETASSDDVDIYEGDDVHTAVAAFVLSVIRFREERRFGTR